MATVEHRSWTEKMPFANGGKSARFHVYHNKDSHKVAMIFKSMRDGWTVSVMPDNGTGDELYAMRISNFNRAKSFALKGIA